MQLREGMMEAETGLRAKLGKADSQGSDWKVQSLECRNPSGGESPGWVKA